MADDACDPCGICGWEGTRTVSMLHLIELAIEQFGESAPDLMALLIRVRDEHPEWFDEHGRLKES